MCAYPFTLESEIRMSEICHINDKFSINTGFIVKCIRMPIRKIPSVRYVQTLNARLQIELTHFLILDDADAKTQQHNVLQKTSG